MIVNLNGKKILNKREYLNEGFLDDTLEVLRERINPNIELRKNKFVYKDLELSINLNLVNENLKSLSLSKLKNDIVNEYEKKLKVC